MTIPNSFIREGFIPANMLRKRRRLMLGSDGPPDSGKTEFTLSVPGPGIVLCLDRGYEAMLDNPNPPETRRDDFAFKVITVPMATSATQNEFLDYWRAFYTEYKKALANVDARVVVLDGDSDGWELQRLAEFGKLTQIPPILYTSVNAARRAMIAKAFDSGKTIIATHKIKKQYKALLNPDGSVALDKSSGREIREWDGKTYQRQGFEDQDYLWQVQISHMYRPATVNARGLEIPQKWGVRITKCKPDPKLVGIELWGEDCNFAGLVQTVYPDVPLSEWGF